MTIIDTVRTFMLAEFEINNTPNTLASRIVFVNKLRDAWIAENPGVAKSRYTLEAGFDSYLKTLPAYQ